MNIEIPNITKLTNTLEEKKGSKIYTLASGNKIELGWKEFDVKNEENKSENNLEKNKEAVIFLPGWAMKADAGAIENLCENFTKESNSKTFAITTKREAMGDEEDRLQEQAKAILEFIKEKGLTEITLAGHSQGGTKAIELAVLLQDSTIKINGLILLDSVGLYEQNPLSVATQFTKDAIIDTPKALLSDDVRSTGSRWSVIKNGLQVAGSIIAGTGKELKTLRKDAEDLSKVNPNLNKLKIPIVIISGTNDAISNPEKIVPSDEINKIKEQTDKDSGYINPREKYLQENTFPNAPYIRVIAPEKLGPHGVPLFRSEKTATTALGFLKRYKERENNINK